MFRMHFLFWLRLHFTASRMDGWMDAGCGIGDGTEGATSCLVASRLRGRLVGLPCEVVS